MEKLEMMYEGKAKKIYATDKADEVIVYYKDDATAFNGEKKGQIEDKGVLNNAITSIRSTEGKTAYDYASENQSLAHDSNYWLLNKK